MENTIYVKEEKPDVEELEGNIQHEDMDVKIEKPDIQEENINIKIEIPDVQGNDGTTQENNKNDAADVELKTRHEHYDGGLLALVILHRI